MEIPLIGLRKRDDKDIKLHHTLQIDIYQEDCKIFDLLVISYCLISIAYKSVYYSLYYVFSNISDIEQYMTIVLDFIGVLYWLYGIYLSYEALCAYSYMRSKDIRSCAENLKYLAIIQTFYFILNSVLIIFQCFQRKMSINEQLLVISILTLLVLSSVFITLYFHSQKLGLAEEIQKFDNSNRENPAYHRSQHILDI
jgi:hypothetical protein